MHVVNRAFTNEMYIKFKFTVLREQLFHIRIFYFVVVRFSFVSRRRRIACAYIGKTLLAEIKITQYSQQRGGCFKTKNRCNQK